MELSKEEVSKLIAEKLAEVHGILAECAEMADAAGVEFSFDGPTYGMGGWFASGEWQASSHSC